MFVTTIANKLAAAALTIVMSATCLLGALAPATAIGTSSATTAAPTQIVA